MAALELMDTFFTAFWIILGMVALVGAWFFFAVISKFKYKVRVREIVNGRKIIIDDKARLIKKDGLEYWKLMKLKDIIPLPPPGAIDITNKGKRVVEVYKNDKGEHFYIEDNHEAREWQPLTTEERDLLINSIDRAEKRRGKKWTEHLPMIAGLAALVLIVVCLMVFYNDMAKPLLEMGDKYNQGQEIQLKIVEKLDNLENKYQVLEGQDAFSNDGETSSTRPPR
jgi:hypothetical protein